MSLDRTRERLRRSSVLDAEDSLLQRRYKSFKERLGRDFSKLSGSSTVQKIRAFLKQSKHHYQQSYEALISELLAWPLRHYLSGDLNEIHLRVTAGEISMSFDGVGLPLNLWNSQRGVNLVEESLTFMQGAGPARPRLHLDPDFGFGPTLINAVARSITLQSCLQGKLWKQGFAHGKPTSEPFSLGFTHSRGSLVTVRPDPDFFGDLPFPHRGLRRLLFHAAHLCPGLRLSLNGEDYSSERGLGDLCRVIEPLKSFQRPFFEFEGQTGGLIARVAAMGLSGRPELRCWLNGSSVLSGTLHEGLALAFAESGWTPSLALVHVISKSPSFDPLEQREARNPIVGEILRELLCPALRDFAYEHR